MKFKYICIIFNIILIFFLLVVALLPLFVLGPEFTLTFWRSGWPLGLVLLAALVGLNAFFLSNRRLFKLLEREDWPALVDYLENRVIHTGHYSPRLVRLLVNSCLVMSDSAAVIRLENKLALTKPSLLESNALAFGAARILAGDTAGAAEFFQTRLEKGKVKEAQWVRWYYGFSRLLSRDFNQAEAEFKALASASTDALITGLSAWFLAETLLKYSKNSSECRTIAVQARALLQKRLKNPGEWRKEAIKVETEVHAAVIRKYIDEAGVWLFRKQEQL